MNLLIDTQAFIYWTTRPEQLPAPAFNAIRSRTNTVYLSLVSAWEMQIKFDLRKLELRHSPASLVQKEFESGAIQLLPITLQHIDGLSRLPNHHRDPFDRLLIAQAIHEGLTIVTSDHAIAKYAVPVLWE